MIWIKNNQFITLLIGVIFVCFILFVTNIVNTEEAYKEVFINDGDTLWSLSDQYRGNTPKEAWIAEVMSANHLQTQMIQSGKLLKIPESLHQYAPDQGIELAGEIE